MAFTDLREFIEATDKLGELKRVDGAHWDLEIGAITELVAERKGPALLFDQIPGFPAGYRVLSHPFSSNKRTALVLGLPPDLTGFEMLLAWRERLKSFEPVPPVEVKSGPVMENALTGDKVDIFKFPTPLWHELDGGRYIGTGSAVITKDPEEGWINIGTYRCMLIDDEPTRLLVKINAQRHARRMITKYHAKGQPCPVAISFGQEPAEWMPATYSGVPWGVSEYDFAGWLRGKPVEVITSGASGLPIPATAEIVIEGEISPSQEGDKYWEGPCSEWLGYFADKSKGDAYVVDIKSILHRNDPILLGTPWMKPPAPLFAIPVQAGAVWEQLEGAGLTGITGVWTPIFDSPFIIVVSLKQMYPGHAKQTALAAVACRAANSGARFVIVVDDDVNIANFEEVFWAVATRCDVDTIEILRNMIAARTDPSLTPEERQRYELLRSRVVIDACRPFARIEDYPAVNKFSDEYREKTINKWKSQIDISGG
ncbi:UbiD family decarboxylase [Chloroflexota bacterium]